MKKRKEKWVAHKDAYELYEMMDIIAANRDKSAIETMWRETIAAREAIGLSFGDMCPALTAKKSRKVNFLILKEYLKKKSNLKQNNYFSILTIKNLIARMRFHKLQKH